MLRRVANTLPLIALLAGNAEAQYLNFSQGLDMGPFLWAVVVAVVLVVAFVGYQMAGTAMKERQAGAVQQKKDRQRQDQFVQRATDLGFKRGESRTLERIATSLAPKSPHNLLTASTGLGYLMADLDKRMEKRRKEVAALDRIKAKLVKLLQQDIHERGTVRVEANVRIWVVQKKDAAPEPALVADEEEEDLFENLESVEGTLLDISEGGAAVKVELPVARGDRIEFWSADSQFVLSELTAGVVSVQTDEAEARTLHLHFIDPDLRELRLVIAEIKSRGEASEP